MLNFFGQKRSLERKTFADNLFQGKGSGHVRGTQRMFASVDHSADRKRMQSFDATAAEKSNKGKLNRLFRNLVETP